MKKKYKVMLSLSILILGVMGINYLSYSDYMAKQKERIETFFKYNYNNVESITFTETKRNPTGSLNFYGYFNNDKEKKFIGKIMPSQKEFEGDFIINGDFDTDSVKFENGKTYTVSEIEKIKREERQNNSQESNSTWFSESSKSSLLNNYLKKF